MALHIDVETASVLDLTKVGAYRYFEHPSTFVRCVGWAIDNAHPQIWFPSKKVYGPPENLAEALRSEDCHAWNASFERLALDWMVQEGQLKSAPTFNQWYCTAAQARSNGLPGQLKRCAAVLGTQVQKQNPHIMRKLSDADYVPSNEELCQLRDYCLDDVRVEREIGSVLPELTTAEQVIYRINEHINDRGIGVDMEFVDRAITLLDDERLAANAELAEITHDAVDSWTALPKMKAFLGIPQMRAEDLDRLIEHFTDDPVKRRVVELRKICAKASTAKYEVMTRQVNRDSRLRGMFTFAGAGQTGRFSSTGVQLHNLPRQAPKDAAARIQWVKDAAPLVLLDQRPVAHQMSELLRGALIPRAGNVFVIGDYSAVEARGLPWMYNVEHEIAAWEAGADRYVEDAEAIGGIDRQGGKVVRLACGFGGKAGALLAMAEGYGIRMTPMEAERQAEAWHAANPWVISNAKKLHNAAVIALINPGRQFPHGRLTYAAERDVNDRWILYCQLPSGRVISYFDVKMVPGHYGPELSSIKPRTGQRASLWYGLLAENADQAICNDLLRHAMVRCHYTGALRIVAHVHDELVIECSEAAAAGTADKVRDLMEDRPGWASDFPLVANVHVAERYTK